MVLIQHIINNQYLISRTGKKTVLVNFELQISSYFLD